MLKKEYRTDKSISQYISKRLIIQMRIFTIIFIVMLGIIIYEIIFWNFSILLTFSGLLLGYVVGLVLSRRYRFNWDEETNKVIGYMDWIGAVILILYFIFTFARIFILGYLFHGASLIVLIICITDGSMIGRVLGTGSGIKKVLKAWEILE